jgi:hypothetical protein
MQIWHFITNRNLNLWTDVCYEAQAFQDLYKCEHYTLRLIIHTLYWCKVHKHPRSWRIYFQKFPTAPLKHPYMISSMIIKTSKFLKTGYIQMKLKWSTMRSGVRRCEETNVNNKYFISPHFEVSFIKRLCLEDILTRCFDFMESVFSVLFNLAVKGSPL